MALRLKSGARGCLLAVITLLLPALAQGQWNWASEAVDESGTFNATAVDTDGNVHLAYMSPEGGGLKYAFRSHDGHWFNMLVDKSSASVNIALDRLQHAHLCYFAFQSLKYASWDGSKWQVQEIAPHSGTRDFNCGIAIGPDGAPHVTWYQVTDASGQPYLHIRHAALKNGTWRARTLDYGIEAGKWNSIRIDPQGRTYVCYSVFKEGQFRTSVSDSGESWAISTIEDGRAGHDPQTIPGMGNAMVLDKNGKPNYSYRDEHTLRYAWPAGDHWRIDIVDPYANPSEDMSWITQRTSVAMDADGRPHIVYETNGALKHAWWDGLKWHVQPMGIEGGQHRYATIAIASDNVIFIGYSDPDDGSMKVLVGTPIVSKTEGVDKAQK